MNWRRFGTTAAAVLCAGLFLGGLVATPAAKAAITGSTITTPTDPAYYNASADASTGQTTATFTVSGTTTGSTPGDMVDIDCYAGSATPVVVAANVPLNGDGSFSDTTASLNAIWNTSSAACRLRAVPAGTTPADPTPFAGPRVAVGVHESNTVASGPNTGLQYDYYLWAGQLDGAFDYVSLADCGIYDGYLFDPTLAFMTTTFYCNAGLFGNAGTRSELQIDGKDAYAPYAADGINPNATGLPAVTYTDTLDPATGNLTIHETDPLVKCTDTTWPPDSTKCATFVPTGVTDNITITQDHDGRVSWFTEKFTGTDSTAHTLDLLWDQNQHFYGPGGGDADNVEYEFPGQSSFSVPTTGTSVSLPATPGTIYIRVHGAADGDMTTGQGAIVYDRPSTGANFTSVNTSDSEFTLHQTGTVPAGGSTSYRFAFIQDFLAANVKSLAQTASNAFVNTLTVSKSGNGTGTVTSSPAGISCGSTCSHGYGGGTSVTLTATAGTGSTFTGWSGGGCSGTGTCTVTTDAATTVTATFSLTPEMLTVSKKGDGKGTVTSSPSGISCGSACSKSYDYGSSVTLNAKAGSGSSFSGWSGACSGKGACTVSLTAAASLNATFVKNCVVPKLKNKSLKKAMGALKSHDCRAGKVKHAFSPSVKKGNVISSKPKAGKHLAHNAKVGLVVSKGKKG
jgi:hypothetical protein